MKPKTALIASLTGTVITALCCFTPILVIGLGVIGLSTWIGYLDYVLLPALAVMLVVTFVSYRRYQRDCRCKR